MSTYYEPDPVLRDLPADLLSPLPRLSELGIIIILFVLQGGGLRIQEIRPLKCTWRANSKSQDGNLFNLLSEPVLFKKKKKLFILERERAGTQGRGTGRRL